MIINHNMNALNAWRNMSSNTVNAGKSMEKLSSGLRINKAGDDAAGLAISEKMRGQIRGLDQASRNAQDGISMIQTAEGALNETHSILQRMRELSVQSSNDSNNVDDRAAIQKEVEQLKSEIDRIGNTTEFNTTKLIDGSIGAKKVPGVDNAAVISKDGVLGAETAAKVTAENNFNAVTNGAIYDLTDDKEQTASFNVDGANISFKYTDAELDAVAYDTTGEKFAGLLQKKMNDAIDEYNTAYTSNVAHVTVTADSNAISIQSGTTGGSSSLKFTANTISSAGDGDIWNVAGFSSAAAVDQTGSEGKFSVAGLAQVNAIADTDTSTVSVDGVDLNVTWKAVGGAYSGTAGSYTATQMDKLAKDIQTDINSAISEYNATKPEAQRLKDVTVSVKDGGIVIQSGSDKQTSSIKFDSSSAAQLLGVAGQNSATQGGGVDFQIGANSGQAMKVTIADMRSEALGIANVDMSTKEGAQAGTTALDAAIKSVSSQRAELGAFQNRLEHTIANLGTSSENLTSAESRIRDVDMAKEMMQFSKNNILSQAAQAMISQANQQPQGVLQLLR